MIIDKCNQIEAHWEQKYKIISDENEELVKVIKEYEGQITSSLLDAYEKKQSEVVMDALEDHYNEKIAESQRSMNNTMETVFEKEYKEKLIQIQRKTEEEMEKYKKEIEEKVKVK